MPSRTVTLAAIVSATAVMALPARADGMFRYLETLSDAPKSVAAIGAWTTTITPTDDQSSRAEALQPTPNPRRLTTGSIPRGAPAPQSFPRINGTGHTLNGIASYYASGELTANGERFDKRALTAAHKTLPFGTQVRVTRVDTGSSVIVRINDRGPFKPGRVIDLSELAAENLGLKGVGLADVRLEVLGK